METSALPLLSLYLNQAFQSWSAAQGALPYFLNDQVDANVFNTDFSFSHWPETLRNLNQYDKTAFIQCVHQEITNRWQQFSSGILNYLSDQTPAQHLSADCIWQKGTTKLWNYAPKALNAPIVLIIPSLINKFYIFDLDRNYSFIHYLKTKGFAPWVIDWDAPGQEESTFSLENYVEDRILPILAHAYHFQQRKVSVIGYCMGGILSLAAAAKEKLSPYGYIDHLTLIATPWDFESTIFYSKEMNPLASSEYLAFLKYCPAFPKEMIQFYFHTHTPQKFLEKFRTFATMNPLAEDTKKVFQIERWANDGVALSTPLALTCFQDWCQNNIFMKKPYFNIQHITVPTVLINGTHDTIVPPASSLPLKFRLACANYQSFDLGHIGLIVGKTAPELSWKFIHHWIQSNYSKP